MNEHPCPPGLHRDLEFPTLAVTWLADSAVHATRHVARTRANRLRLRRGSTLKPGWDTPLWNELRKAVARQLTRYGDKARLGRILGLPRQRIQDLIRARRHMPDAERTLRLLLWLEARTAGKDLG